MPANRLPDGAASAPPHRRRLNLTTAAGALLIIIAATGLLTYAALSLPTRLAAASGPPQAFREAATAQAASLAAQEAVAVTPAQGGGESPGAGQPGPPAGEDPLPPETPSGPTPTLHIARPSATDTPTPEPAGGFSGLPDWANERYWLSIPRIGLEAPVLAFAPRVRDVDGVPVERLPVPNFYAVGWDETSAEPGFAGNTIMAGHDNLFGAVFGGLTELQVGDEIAVWSEYGVFSYRVQQTLLLEEEGQPLEVRLQNAQWLNDTPDDRLTLITCWPRESYTHRLIIVATR